jgi:hypothetical protein
MRNLLGLIAAAAGAAAVMYYFDPDMGAQRRRRLLRRTRASSGGMAAAQAQRAAVSDAQLRDRVRARIDQLVSHPGAIEVQAEDGMVRLSGNVLAKELDGLLMQVRDTMGVKRVVNAMQAHDTPESMSGVQVRDTELTTEGQPS